MKKLRLNIILFLGFFAIAGILSVQLVLLHQSYKEQGTKFSQQVQVVLLDVVDQLYELSDHEFPLQNPIKKVGNAYYIVNVNNDFDPSLLEFCLRNGFEKAGLLVDFEYAVYKCASDEMVLGNYVSLGHGSPKKTSFQFPKDRSLVYYFAVRFPSLLPLQLADLRLYIILSAILVLILFIYLYSVFTILQQKRYTELQRDFINNMTHEFKTPLSSILIAARYLQKQPAILGDERMRQYAAIITDQGAKLNTHIEKILNVARWDHKAMSLKMERVDLPGLIREVCDSLSQNTPFQFEIRLQEERVFVQADRFHLTNLVFNLIDNSIKYSQERPRVIIDVQVEKSQVRVNFTDNGMGIPEENLELVFEKFYRVKRNPGTERNGFGLGLHYVRKICDLHRWKVQLRNNQGAGITVSLMMPQS